jgi:uncharacterized membrane protein HdeD (DUF308 family)
MAGLESRSREPMWLVGIVGLAMLYLGTWAVVMAAAAWWPVAVLLGAVLLGVGLLGAGLVLAAWRMQASHVARSLRIILFGLGVLSLLVGGFVGLTGMR